MLGIRCCARFGDAGTRHLDAVDPLVRYRNMAKAYLAGNLDPAFPILTAFELSMSVDTDATEEDLCGNFDMIVAPSMSAHLAAPHRPAVAGWSALQWPVGLPCSGRLVCPAVSGWSAWPVGLPCSGRLVCPVVAGWSALQWPVGLPCVVPMLTGC